MLAGRGKHYGGNNGMDRLSYPMYQEIRDKNQVFSGMFCTYPSTVSIYVSGQRPNSSAQTTFREISFRSSGSGPRWAGSSPPPTT